MVARDCCVIEKICCCVLVHCWVSEAAMCVVLMILHGDCRLVWLVVGVWGVLCENCIVDASIFILVEEFFDCKFA